MARQPKEGTFNIQQWFDLLDKYAAEEPFVLNREQTVTPERVVFVDDLPEGNRDP